MFQSWLTGLFTHLCFLIPTHSTLFLLFTKKSIFTNPYCFLDPAPVTPFCLTFCFPIPYSLKESGPSREAPEKCSLPCQETTEKQQANKYCCKFLCTILTALYKAALERRLWILKKKWEERVGFILGETTAFRV